MRSARRTFLLGAGAATATLLDARPGHAASPSGARDIDARAERILARVRPPTFAQRDHVITDYGAIGDGVADCTPAFRAAITRCTATGGGRVVVPAGTFHTGAIHLSDNVELHLDSDATIAFSRDPASYLPVVYTRYEGVELYNYSPFIYAYYQSNIAITGGGVIDGRASDEHWWSWTGGEPPNEYDDKELLNGWAEQGVPVAERVFGGGHFLRPNLIQFYRCANILLEGITVKDSPMWNIHPVLSMNITIRDITVDSPHGPNNDGCNPESCSDVVIQDCTLNTGDDCVAFKAGKNADGRRVNVPCENALVERCEMADGNGGVTVGSETTGGISTILARDCQMDSPRLERALRIKTNPERGGYVRDVFFHNITVGNVADSVIEIALDYAGVDTGDHYPDVRDMAVHKLEAQTGPRALYLIGNEHNPISDVLLHDCVFADMDGASTIEHAADVTAYRVTINGEPWQFPPA